MLTDTDFPRWFLNTVQVAVVSCVISVMVGALGACFGRVVTLDSPRARPPGSFNWQATLWHELAHVFAIQRSRSRVPLPSVA